MTTPCPNCDGVGFIFGEACPVCLTWGSLFGPDPVANADISSPADQAPAKGDERMAEQNKWQNILDLLSATGNFYRPKGPKTKIRLVPMPKGSEEFFHEVQSTFRGNTKTKYILSGLVIDGKGAREEMAHTVTPIIVSKVVLKGILGLLAEGYDLLDEESGFGLVINRAGEGLNTTYAVMPSKSAQPLPANLDRGEQDLPQMAAAYEAWNSQSRNSRATEDDDGEGGPHNEPEW